MAEESTFGRITEEGLAELRSRIGLERPIVQWNEMASKDTIYHFAEGLGDDNPLWTDEEYASKTRYGCILAPPLFLHSCCMPAGGAPGGGLPGVFGMWAQDLWEWYLPIRVNDRISGNGKLVEVKEKEGRYAGKMVEQTLLNTFYNQKGEVIAKYWNTALRFERKAAREKGKYTKIEKYRYSEEEMQRIEEAYLKEKRRGAEPRYWEDTRIGEEVTPLVKGPLTVTSMVTWLMGWGSPLCKTDRIAHLYMQKRPGARMVDPVTNVPDLPEASHWNEELARHSGLPAGYDIGAQRISWFGHLMTDWIGDDGFLKRLKVQLRGPNLVGDTMWCKGKVIDKRIEGSEHLVECEMWGENQKGEITTRSNAVVVLPSRKV